LTAHAACKGSISQLVNCRFEPLERPINRGFRMLAHRSIREPSSVPEVTAQNCTLWPTAVSLPDRSSANSVCATGGGRGVFEWPRRLVSVDVLWTSTRAPVPAPDPMAALGAGSQLGPYEVESLIAKGGMGEVYRARDARWP